MHCRRRVSCCSPTQLGRCGAEPARRGKGGRRGHGGAPAGRGRRRGRPRRSRHHPARRRCRCASPRRTHAQVRLLGGSLQSVSRHNAGVWCPRCLLNSWRPAHASERSIGCAGFNKLPVVKALLAGGANVALTDARGNTPLHYAAGAAPLIMPPMQQDMPAAHPQASAPARASVQNARHIRFILYNGHGPCGL